MTKIHVTTATALSPRMLDEVERWLNNRYGTVSVQYHVDDSLIGGIVIFDGETVFDGSVKGKLKGLNTL